MQALKECKEIEFVVDNTKFDSVEEFVAEVRGQSPREISIKARDPYLNIDLDKFSARLYVSSSQLIASGIFFQLDAILSRCERKPKFVYSYKWTVGSLWILPNIFYLPPLKPFAYLQIWVSVLILTWVLYAMYVALLKHVTTYPVYREYKQSFLKRNFDSVAIAVISAFIGAVGGVAATKFADHFWPNSPVVTIEQNLLHDSSSANHR